MNRRPSPVSGPRADAANIFRPNGSTSLSLDDAYRIQLGVIARRIAQGERQIGWKVGLTAPAIQQQFGFHEPVFGCLLETGHRRAMCSVVTN